MMRTRSVLMIAVLALVSLPATSQVTPPSVVAAYDALADTILALRAAEADFVAALLDGHRHAAEALKNAGKWEAAAAEMALFASEGDNAIAGVRKRLLEGGHHFNAEEEEAGVYEPGFVIVTREAKEKVLAISAALRQATTAEARTKAWEDFATIAGELLKRD